MYKNVYMMCEREGGGERGREGEIMEGIKYAQREIKERTRGGILPQ